MADVVRLAIVYDTGQAAAQLVALNQRGAQLTSTTNKLSAAANIGGGRLRGMALAGARLGSSLGAGDLSAKGLASTIGRLAGPSAFGALAVTVINIVNALEEFKRISDDVTNTIDAMQTASRDATRDVARMLGEAPAESNTEKAIKRLRDAAAQMRKEAARIGGAAGKLLTEQAAQLEGQIPGIGQRGRNQIAREAAKDVQEYNQSLQNNAVILQSLNAGPMAILQSSLALQRKRYEDLIGRGMDPASEKARDMADALNIGAEALSRMQHQAKLFEDGLFTMADAIEEFVVTGTFAFTEFLNNILRLLWRDASGELIGGIVGGLSGGGPKGGADVGPVKLPGGGKVLTPSVQSNVTFQVQTMDAQGVATWLNQNGPQIAAVVGNQAARARGLRKQMGGR